jgi:hypothetical protein
MVLEMYNTNGMVRIPNFYFAVLLGLVGLLAYSYFCNKATNSGEPTINKMSETENIYTENDPNDIIEDVGSYT